ncbi:hypothetical protein OG689_37840 [Kitasatospora sp. NBC_00240]|uniref:hypothetical protein n=1 Tax=Kitasatospora sp. NBC_00240 TaxID=2903567 RepID=UPI00224F7646|nr:hypothetical protein [Kitasatospora sp. NBC_00240]MCX5214960.1 hypothetical protein [Kitasatospora sp. NBC_00240]
MSALPAVPGGTATLFGLAGLLLLLVVLAQLGARRAGGWRVVRRRLRREAAATAAAFAAPVRAQLRYRRHLRLLVRLLGDRSGWADAERAALGAGRVPGVEPYGVLLGRSVVGVLVACGPAAPPRPPEPWAADDTDPRLWWLDRADAAGVATGGRPAPLLAALGTDGRHAVLLDLATGPAVTVLGGDKGTARAVLQALAAQLDARLPAGAVTVAEGVNPRHTGPEPAAALALAERAATGGAPAFAVCAELPAGARPAAGSRLLALSGARGSARLLTADRAGLSVLGTGLRVDAVPLARATARSLPLLPPYPAHDAGPTDDSDLAEPALGVDAPGGPEQPAPAGLPGRSALGPKPVPVRTAPGPFPGGVPAGELAPAAGTGTGSAPGAGRRVGPVGPATGEAVEHRPDSAEFPGRSALAPPSTSHRRAPDLHTPDLHAPDRTGGPADPVGPDGITSPADLAAPTGPDGPSGPAGPAVPPAPVAPVAPSAPAAPEPDPGPPPLVLGRVIVPGRAIPPGAPRPRGAVPPPVRPRFVQRPAPTDGADPASGQVPREPDPADPFGPPAAGTDPAIPGVRGRLRLPPPAVPAGDEDTFGPVRPPGGPDLGRVGAAPAVGGATVLAPALPGPVTAPAGARPDVPVVRDPADDDLAEPAPEPGSGPPGVSAAVPT